MRSFQPTNSSSGSTSTPSIRPPARFDLQKLEAINGHWIRTSDDDELYERIKNLLPHIPHGDAISQAFSLGAGVKLRALIPAMKERSKTLLDLLDGAKFLWAERPMAYDEKANKLLDESARAILGKLLSSLQQLPDWTPLPLETAIREFAEAEGLKLGKVAQPLRAALTGTTVSPSIFEVMAVLGEPETLGRLKDAAG